MLIAISDLTASRFAPLVRSVGRPSLLILSTLLMALAFWVGGLPAIIGISAALPIAVLLAGSIGERGGPRRDGLTGLLQRDGLVRQLDQILHDAAKNGRSTGALVIEIDRFKLLEERMERTSVERVIAVTAQRLEGALRDSDVAARLDGPKFAVALAAVRRLDLETVIQLAGRLQRTLAEPISDHGSNIYVTVSVGFSLAFRLGNPSGESVLQAATLAMIEAQRSGPSGIRSYSDAMKARITSRSILAKEVSEALEKDEINAFFQPQISTRSGEITGFEALARWHHPERGLIPPAEFLPALAQAGMMDRLGERMVRDALAAVRRWEDQGFSIPRVGVNFSSEELHDPRLVDRIAWELDRFELTPDRLVVEVLESVVANRSEDVVIRNLSGLARLGCCLDLDDFGTGHASITSIRRFSIERIKIDRSFVTRIDEDPEQQKMVSAILTMAERLGLDTLAEGVETSGERAMLAKLGCGHVQGFGIARPMPLHETDVWIRNYDARRGDVPCVHLRVV
ncbi:MAG: bifunctional diguanylate cyclase/phosphodiesterase [Rhodobacterales bacterium]|nr:bifunctional diguanylate cyclase/phosphodiesterase [Rhodobacterales bacterium]